MLAQIAIVGRPNVGKSTLFNRLVGKMLALVDDRPGVTRDRREGEGRLGDLRFKVVDTAGLEDADAELLQGRMRQQTELAAQIADVILFVVDAEAGILPDDEYFGRWLRKTGKPVLVIANKAESKAGRKGVSEFHAMGLGEPIGISASHGEGMSDLFEALIPILEPEKSDDFDEPEVSEKTEEKPMSLAIVGRPNAGKSTLINQLLGAERLLTGPEPGITRDAITLDWQYRGKSYKLVDTAGMRKRARVTEKLEKLAVADGLRAIRFAEVCVLLCDAAAPLEKQDLDIAHHVLEEGRALVVAINKWDMVEDGAKRIKEIRDRVGFLLPNAKGVPVVTISGLTGSGIDQLMKAVAQVYAAWNKKISTNALNRWLAEAQEQHAPPMVSGRRIKLRFASQANIRPPTFALFANKPGDLPPSYIQYLANSLREVFKIPGTPIRIMLRKGSNPYSDK